MAASPSALARVRRSAERKRLPKELNRQLRRFKIDSAAQNALNGALAELDTHAAAKGGLRFHTRQTDRQYRETSQTLRELASKLDAVAGSIG